MPSDVPQQPKFTVDELVTSVDPPSNSIHKRPKRSAEGATGSIREAKQSGRRIGEQTNFFFLLLIVWLRGSLPVLSAAPISLLP